jgi:hypothetical protein
MQALLRDAGRAVRALKHEFAGDDRIYIPGARMFVGGVFTARYQAPDADAFGPAVIAANRVPAQGLNEVLNLLGGHSAAAPLYIAPFSGNVAVADDWTAANFTGNSTEFIAYTPGTRLPWTTVPSTAKSLSNAAALAASTLTFNAGGPYTIRGAGLLTDQARSATTGKLLAASRFDADLTGMMGGGKLALEYALQALDESDA